jgi:hypothetical protein
MKRVIFSLLGIVMTVTIVRAQTFRLGVAAGVDVARLTISGVTGGPVKSKSDLAGGISGEAVISKLFALQLEANYSAQGTGVIDANGTTAGTYQFSYITIPLMAKLYGTPELSFFAGPQIGLLLKAKTKSSTAADQDVKDQLESTDFYAVFGTEYRFKNGVFIGARYNAGLTNIAKDKTSNSELKNRYISLRLGYSFALK